MQETYQTLCIIDSLVPDIKTLNDNVFLDVLAYLKDRAENPNDYKNEKLKKRWDNAEPVVSLEKVSLTAAN